MIKREKKIPYEKSDEIAFRGKKDVRFEKK